MKSPGNLLLRLAARFFREETLDQIISPAIADLQKEHRDAALEPRWRRTRLLAAGYLGVWKVLAMSGSDVFGAHQADRYELRRVFAVSAGAIFALTAILMMAPFVGFWEFARFEDLILLVPQAVPLALPIGAAVGLAFGMRRPTTRAVSLRLVLVALACSAAMLATMNWVMPAANQSFRQNVFTATGNEGVPIRGFNEMTLRELARESRAATLFKQAHRARQVGWYYHTRWSLSLATLAITVLTLSAHGRTRRAGRALLALTPFVYGLVMWAGEHLAMEGVIAPITGAWLPMIVFGMGTAVVAILTEDHRLGLKTADLD